MIFDRIENINNYKGLGRVYTALEFMAKTDFTKMPVGKYQLDGDNIYYMVQSYDTNPDKTIAEAHKKYIDIQYIVKGEEIIAVAPIQGNKKLTEAKEEKDVYFYECDTKPVVLNDGDFMVLYPSDLHLPGKAVEEPCEVLKVVFKVLVD
jgi:YhcH/YjgK/YiaL family protein